MRCKQRKIVTIQLACQLLEISVQFISPVTTVTWLLYYAPCGPGFTLMGFHVRVLLYRGRADTSTQEHWAVCSKITYSTC